MKICPRCGREYAQVDGGLDILGKPTDCPLVESEDKA